MRGTGTGRHGNGARHAQRTNDPPRSCVSACSRSLAGPCALARSRSTTVPTNRVRGVLLALSRSYARVRASWYASRGVRVARRALPTSVSFALYAYKDPGFFSKRTRGGL